MDIDVKLGQSKRVSPVFELLLCECFENWANIYCFGWTCYFSLDQCGDLTDCPTLSSLKLQLSLHSFSMSLVTIGENQPTMFIFDPQQQKNLEGYVGFANLPNQVYRKSVKRGFEFTLMVVGE